MAWIEPHPMHLPSPQDIAEGRAIIRDADLRIAALSDQIEPLERLKSHFQTIRDNQTSFLSTFRRLPPEILKEIALHYLNAQTPRGFGVLDQVCSSFRAVIWRMKWMCKTINIVQPRMFHWYPVSPFIEY
jgi:hypothetical protein